MNMEPENILDAEVRKVSLCHKAIDSKSNKSIMIEIKEIDD